MPSLYRILESSESRLVLEGRKLGLWLLTLFLLTNASVLLYVGLFVISRRQLFPVVAGSALGAFFAVCGLATMVKALRYKSRIEIDRRLGTVRLMTGHGGRATEIPFAEIASVELESKRIGSGRRARYEQRVFLLTTDDSEWLLDRSTDIVRMTRLADRIRLLTHGRRAQDEPKVGAPDGEGRPAPWAEAPPDGVTIESDRDAVVYRWRTLPRALLWVFFWGSTTLLLGGLAVAALVAMVIEICRQPPGVTLALLALAALTLGLMYAASRRARRGGAAVLGLALFAVLLANLLFNVQPFIKAGAVAAAVGYIASLSGWVLLTRCRLRVSPAGLEYEEQLLGLPLFWRRHTLTAAEVVGFRIKAAVRGGGAVEVRARGGRSFALMIPQGTGAFSRADLEWLRARWLADLGAQASGTSPR